MGSSVSRLPKRAAFGALRPMCLDFCIADLTSGYARGTMAAPSCLSMLFTKSADESLVSYDRIASSLVPLASSQSKMSPSALSHPCSPTSSSPSGGVGRSQRVAVITGFAHDLEAVSPGIEPEFVEGAWKIIGRRTLRDDS